MSLGETTSSAGRASHLRLGPNSGQHPTARSGADKPVGVLCVDDHALLVEGLKAQFAISGEFEVVGRLASAELLVETVEKLKPEVVLLDVEMPGPDAFESASRLRQFFPSVAVVVLSAHVRDAFVTASFTSGVCAYFAKSDELEDIVDGLRAAVRRTPGMFLLGPRVREHCLPGTPLRSGVTSRGRRARPADELCDGTPMTLLNSLTHREVEILRLIGKGLTRIQIAEQLCRSAKTIDGHQVRMMKKLGIPERANLMRFAIREGLAQA
ncbi:MAG: response regulator transcription factor [Phycisphaerales bacterium]|nr:response regulator transcription factor [Phycisphaerales bacterium]